MKLYFMCGLPTETDEDVLEIAGMARRVIADRSRGGRAQGHPLHGLDRRVRAEAAHAVPVGGAARPRDRRPAAARVEGRRSPTTGSSGARSGCATTTAEPSIIEGLLSRGDRRVGAVIRAVWEDGQRFDGWSEYFSFDRWKDACREVFEGEPVVARLVHHPGARAVRGAALGPPRLRAGQGLALGGLAGRARPAVEHDDCRWTPCFDCGVCPSMGTDIQVGPTGRPLLPLTPV